MEKLKEFREEKNGGRETMPTEAGKNSLKENNEGKSRENKKGREEWNKMSR